MNIRWDYFVNQYDTARYVSAVDGRDNRHIQFVREFASVVSVLQDKTNSVIDLYKDIMRAVEDLTTCAYTTEAFSELLAKIQAAVSLTSLPLDCVIYHSLQIDRLNLEGYANLEHWVAELDTRIEAILLQRLTHIIKVWCEEFDRTDDGDIRREAPVRDIVSKRRGDKRVKEEKVG